MNASKRKHHDDANPTNTPTDQPTVSPPAPVPGLTPVDAGIPDRPVSQARKVRIKLFGVGGAGCNAVTHIAQTRETREQWLTMLDLVAVNTDLQALDAALATEKIQIGTEVTHGLGAGGDSDLGSRAAQHDADVLSAACRDLDVVFILAGLGGGTGTGASAVLARIAKQQGALVLALVTVPFGFEGDRRRQQATDGLDELRGHADAVICVPNDRLFKVVGEGASVVEAFQRGNEFMATGVQAVWQLLARKGLINLDFADLRATLNAKHSDGLLSHGEAEGADRARNAVKAMLENPLFDGHETLTRADSVLVSILGGTDLALGDVQKAMEPITRQAPQAHIIMGAAVDEAYNGKLAVTMIAATQAAPRKPAVPSNGAILSTTNKAAANGTVPRKHVPANGNGGVSLPNKIVPAAAVSSMGSTSSTKSKEPAPTPKQETLPLQTASRGRFDKTEPTLHNGQDLDVPTFIRKGIALSR
jgi:cell division protein FtsZ